MKVSLGLPTDVEVPFPDGFVRLNEVRGGERRVDVIEVAFAEEVDAGVEVRIHGKGEYVVDGSLRATYDM